MQQHRTEDMFKCLKFSGLQDMFWYMSCLQSFFEPTAYVATHDYRGPVFSEQQIAILLNNKKRVCTYVCKCVYVKLTEETQLQALEAKRSLREARMRVGNTVTLIVGRACKCNTYRS